MKHGNIESFKHLSKFRDTKDFNNNIEQWMIDVKNMFTKSEMVALKRLIRFSAKIAGVCNAKIATITKATHEHDGVGISRSTFKRMVVKAKEISMLHVFETERKNGSKSSNVYVFNRFCVEAEPSNGEKLNHPQTDNLSKTTNQNNKKRTKDVSSSKFREKKLDASFVTDKIPVPFTNLVKYFFDDAKQIEEYWKLVTISAFKSKVKGEIVEVAIQAFKTLIRKIKFSKVRNSYGFFYGVLNRKFKALSLKEKFNDWWYS